MILFEIILTLILLISNVVSSPPLLFSGDDQVKPGLGINLGPVDYGMNNWVFTNKFKHSREWRQVSSNDNWKTFGWTGAFSTVWSSDGYPLNFTSRPYGTTRWGYMTELGTYGKYPTGGYMISFQGTGNLTVLGDAKALNFIAPNKAEFYINETTTKGIVIIVTEPNTYNIDLREKFEEFYNETFGLNFTSAIQMFEALRYSAWMVRREGSNNPIANQQWSTRRPASYYTQVGQNMISIEYIIELANFLSKDIWLSIPSSASSDYIYKIAEYVNNNLQNSSKMYIEQSSDKGFNANNRTSQMDLIRVWKSVFGNNNPRVKYVLSTWLTAYFENTMSFYTDDDLKQFHVYSVAGDISYGIDMNYDSYNVTDAANYTVKDIIDLIRQEIYKDELSIIYQVQKVAIKLNMTLIGYNVGFLVHAPGFLNRWKKTNYSEQEQKLEDLIIEALRQPIVEDLYLDYMERWWKCGGGLMFLNNIVDLVNRCPNGGGKCGYVSLLENLGQDPSTVPKYRAAVKWLNGQKSQLPFTSADIPKQEKLNCTSCVWGTCYNGSCVCFDGYTGPYCDVLQKKFLDCAPNSTEYGVNLNGVPDWSTELTFIDLQRRARKWIAHKIVFATAWAELNQDDIQLRDDGYPRYLEIGKMVGTFLTRDLQARFPNGDYVCLYDGDGALEFWFNDVKITKRGPGRIEMKVNHKTEMNNGIYYNIVRTNPSNPIRNVRIFEARFEKIFETFPFHPTYLEYLRKYKTIRFMPWSRVNVDEETDWTNRTTDFYYTFNLKTGVSLEKQVLLINTLGANPWFNLPHRATDDYITNWALYVKNNLRPDVKIYIEVGNECWGSGAAHECGNWAQKMGYSLNYTISAKQNYYGLDLQGRICYHAHTGKRYLDIIKTVFGSSYNRSRIKLVLGTQAAWQGPLEIFYLCKEKYYEFYDVISIAPYMSESLKNADGSLISLDEVYNSTVHKAIQNSVQAIKMIASLINSTAPYHELALYEAGPDFSSLFETSNIALTELSLKIHRDARMYQAMRYYLSNITRIQGVNLKVYNHYASAGTYSKYGCWGLIESSDMNPSQSPKYNAYMDHIDSEKLCPFEEKEYLCQNNCTSNGICGPNLLTSKKEVCSCYFGSNGNQCEIFDYIISERCTYMCNFKGVCEYNHTEGLYKIHTCHCKPGYYGYGCELFDCPYECNYNGRCIDNDTCSCFRGFKGKYCDIDCGCNTHGVCSNSTNQCICDPGYSFVLGKCELDCSLDSKRSECLSCPPCGNGNCVRGSCVCWAGFKQDMLKSCTIKTKAPNDGSKLGINLNGVVDWSTQWAFVDLAKQARNWIIQHMDNLNTLYIWSLDEKFNLTQDRYPTNVPFQRKFVTLMLRDVKQYWPDSIYNVFFDGEGELDFGFDATVIEYKDKNKLKIKTKLSLIRDNGVLMKIRKINPVNPIRNIRIIMDGFEDIYDKIPFHPLFMERLSMFKTIRFMPWTEEYGIVKWSDRVTPQTYSQGKGVAYEHQIQLSNILKTNPWFTVPFGADDGFVTEMARLILAQLRKDLTIYIEYTNEAWNDFFESGKYCIEMGLKLGLSSDKVIARNLYYSKRSKEIIEIFKNVFGSEKNRIVLVLGSFILMPQMSTRILDYNNAYLSHTNVMLAITGYISCSSPSASQVAITDLSVLFAGCDSDLIPIKTATLRHSQIAKAHNISFGFYESGSGLSELEAIFSGSETPGATDKYIQWNRDPRMYKVYKDYYKMYDEFNLTENCHYAYVGQPSKYGPWYLLEYQNQSINEAHRYRAILDLINETRTDVKPIQELSCFGKLYNSSDVCNSQGICIASDTCKPFSRPSRTSDILVSPQNGIALVQNFLLSTTAWNSDFPLKYAFGFNDPDKGYIRLTDFADNPRAVSLLPYVGKEYEIVLFVKDSQDNIITDVTSFKLNIQKFNGTLVDLNNLISKLSISQKIVALNDRSFSSDELTKQVLNNIDLSLNNFDNGLSQLEYLTSNLQSQENIFVSIGSKIDGLLTSISTAIETNGNSSVMSLTQSSSIVSVISNMFEKGSQSVAEKLINNFTILLTKIEPNTNETVNGMSTVTLKSKSFNVSVASFNLRDVVSKYINYSDIKADLSSIFPNTSNTKGNIALINFAKDLNQSIVSNQIDLKFYSNGTLIKVKNLQNPVVLQFSVDQSVISVLSLNNKLSCKYYDEITNTWKSDGCVLSSYDPLTKQVNCNCDHTTKFSVLLEKSTGSTESIVNTILGKNEALKIKKFSTSEILIGYLILLYLNF